MENVFAVTYFETLFYSAYKPHPEKSLRLQTYPKPRKKLYSSGLIKDSLRYCINNKLFPLILNLH